MTKFCSISDLHGNLDVRLKPCDVLLICGDIVPPEYQSNLSYSKKWFKDTFIPWCLKRDCQKVVFIAGNHDKFLAQKEAELFILLEKLDPEKKIEYLGTNNTFKSEMKLICGKLIYGTPWCSIFGNWSFMSRHEEQTEMYSGIIKFLNGNNLKIDIVLSHDAPYGVSDVLDRDNPWDNTTHCGNVALKNFLTVTQPKYNVHGHLHSTNHEVEYLGNTTVVNTSIMDDRYNMKYKPYYFEL